MKKRKKMFPYYFSIFIGNKSGNYEDLFCANSGQMGVGILGDSTGAHFGVPIAPLAPPRLWVRFLSPL